MEKYTFNCPITGEQWERVSKQTAKNLFAKGEKIKAIPHKCRLFGVWLQGFDSPLSDEFDTDLPQQRFDKWSNSVEYYNGCYELGYYNAFYKKSK